MSTGVRAIDDRTFGQALVRPRGRHRGPLSFRPGAGPPAGTAMPGSFSPCRACLRGMRPTWVQILPTFFRSRPATSCQRRSSSCSRSNTTRRSAQAQAARPGDHSGRDPQDLRATGMRFVLGYNAIKALGPLSAAATISSPPASPSATSPAVCHGTLPRRQTLSESDYFFEQQHFLC